MAYFQGRLPLVFWGVCTSNRVLFFLWLDPQKLRLFDESQLSGDANTASSKYHLSLHRTRWAIGHVDMLRPNCGMSRLAVGQPFLHKNLRTSTQKQRSCFPGVFFGNVNTTSEANYGEFFLCFVLRSTTKTVSAEIPREQHFRVQMYQWLLRSHEVNCSLFVVYREKTVSPVRFKLRPHFP